MTVNKGDKVLITDTDWEGSVATVVEVVSFGIRVMRDEDPQRTVGILMASEWEPYEEASKAIVGARVKIADASGDSEWENMIGTVIPQVYDAYPIAVRWDNGDVFNCLYESEVAVVTDEEPDEEPNKAIDALRAIRSRLADNALVFGHREDILAIIATVKGV